MAPLQPNRIAYKCWQQPDLYILKILLDKTKTSEGEVQKDLTLLVPCQVIEAPIWRPASKVDPEMEAGLQANAVILVAALSCSHCNVQIKQVLAL